MKKKIIKITSMMTLCSVLLAGCGVTTHTDTENSTAASDEGGIVNIYCWNDEFQRRVKAHYPGYEEVDATHGKIGDV